MFSVVGTPHLEVTGNSCYLVPPISEDKGGGGQKILSMSGLCVVTVSCLFRACVLSRVEILGYNVSYVVPGCPLGSHPTTTRASKQAGAAGGGAAQQLLSVCASPKYQ